MILAQELRTIDSEIASLIALIEAKRQHQEVLASAEDLASEALSRLNQAVSRIGEVAPSAIASLKTAVLTLFADGDGGNNDGGNPTPDPTPDTGSQEPEVLCFNGQTGDYLLSDGTTSIEEEGSVPCVACGADLRDEANYPEYVAAALAGICRSCEAQAIEAEEKQEELNGQAYIWASPLACLIWEDAPLLGQHCTITLSATEDNENKSTNGGEAMPYVELVKVSDAIAYQKKSATGEIICAYFGFRTKAHAKSWLHFFEAITSKVEVRSSKRIEGFRWEIKAKGVSMRQIERYAKDCDFTQSYSIPSEKQSKETPAQAAGIEPPADWGKPQPMHALVLHKDSDYYGQTLPITRVSSNEIGYTVKLPNGEDHWFLADLVQILDADIVEAALPTEPDLSEEDLEDMAASGFDHMPAPEPEFIQTNGNYVGLSRQIRQHWEKAGIDPSDLIAEMKAKRPPEPAWDAARFNPVLTAMATDDLDF